MRWHQGCFTLNQAIVKNGCSLVETAAFRGIAAAVAPNHLVPVRVMVSILRTCHLAKKQTKKKKTLIPAAHCY